MFYKCPFRSYWFAVLSKSSIPLFTFCLFVLTIIVDGALNSPVLTVFFKFKFIYFNWRLNYFTILYWFCHTSTWICHGCTRVPNSEPPSHLPSHTSLWVIPVHQPELSCILHWTWTGDSFLIWHYTYFNAILPNHPTLALSHRVQKTVLYICVSFAVSNTGLSLPSF